MNRGGGMNDDIAKLHLSIKDGVFEISGSEKFVTSQIENFKDIILDALKTKGMQQPLSPEVHEQVDSPPTKQAYQTKTDTQQYPNVLHIEGTDVRVIKRVSGSNKAQKSLNTVLVYLWAKRTVGVEDTTLKSLRKLCEQQGCLDKANFAKTIKGAREHIIVDGVKGSSAQKCKLTMPGVEKAEELLESLNG